MKGIVVAVWVRRSAVIVAVAMRVFHSLVMIAAAVWVWLVVSVWLRQL